MERSQPEHTKRRRWSRLGMLAVIALTIVVAFAFLVPGIPVPGTARYYPTTDLNALAYKVTSQCSRFGSRNARAEVDTLRRRLDVYDCVLDLNLLTPNEREMLSSHASYGPNAVS